MADHIITILVGILCLFVGAILTYYIDYDRIKRQGKFDDDRKRLEILRNIVGHIIPYIDSGTKNDWVIPDESKKQTINQRRKYRDEIDLSKVYFPAEKNNDVNTALSLLSMNLWTAGELEEYTEDQWDDLGGSFILNKVSSVFIDQIRKTLENKIDELSSILFDV